MAEININGWRTAYRGIISDEYLFINMNIEKSIENHKKWTAEHPDCYYVFENNGIIQGFASIGGSRDCDCPGALELCALYVDPYFKRQGIGSELLAQFESLAVEQKRERCILWVLEKNEAAIAFYRNFGFNFDGAQKLIEQFNAVESRMVKKL